MSAPLLSTLLVAITLLVIASAARVDAWRPAPLLMSADRPKFPFGGKRREPGPVDEGTGLLGDIAGGRYGGGQTSLPTFGAGGPPPGRAGSGPTLPRLHPDADGTDAPRHDDGYDPGHDDGIAWAPAGGSEATVWAAPAPPLPGDPGWPREIGLLEAIANMPAQPWDAASDIWPVTSGPAPATPPLPLGPDPMPPFADLAPEQPWERPAPPPPPPPPHNWDATAPAWGPGALATGWDDPASDSTPAAGPAPSEDPDSWHSWQWQPDAAAGHDVAPPPPPRVTAPSPIAPAGPAGQPPRPSIWAAPVTPAVDAWADAPAPPAPDALLTGWDADRALDLPAREAPASTWTWNDETAEAGAPVADAPPPPTPTWDTPAGWTAPGSTAPVTPERAAEAWPPDGARSADDEAPAFSSVDATPPVGPNPMADRFDRPATAADPTGGRPVPAAAAPPATDEWEALRGAFAGPDNATDAPLDAPVAGATTPPAAAVTPTVPAPAPLVTNDPWADGGTGYDPFGLGPVPFACPTAAAPDTPFTDVAPASATARDDGAGRAGADATPAASAGESQPEPATDETAATDAFDERFARGLQLRLTGEQSVEFLARGAAHLLPHAGTQVLVASTGVDFDHDNRSSATAPAGCGVPSADLCPAIVQGTAFRFTDSSELDACPYLADRGGSPCAAVCIPLPALGAAGGVVHVTTAVDASLTAAEVRSLERAVAQVAERLVVLRSRAGRPDQAKSAITGA